MPADPPDPTVGSEPARRRVFWLHRPYFDLADLDGEASLGAAYPLLAYAALDTPFTHAGQRQLREEFRFALLHESGLHEYARLSPLELAPSLRTERWDRLCALVDAFHDQPVGRRVRVARLLIALGFHRLVVDLVAPDAPQRITDEHSAGLAYMRVMAKHCLHVGRSTNYPTDELTEVVRQAPRRTRTSFSAAMTLLTAHAKYSKDAAAVRSLREIAAHYVDHLSHTLDEDSFDYHFFHSRFFRGASYAPYLEGDFRRVKQEMELCEAHARLVPRGTPFEDIVARDNLYIALESQMRSVLATHDLDRAHELAREIVELDPWDSRAHLELGEVLMMRRRFDEALGVYRRAARLGPPGTAVAHFMAAHCAEAIGNLETALDEHLRALRVDPGGISPLEPLERVARALGQAQVARWARRRSAAVARSPEGAADRPLPELEPIAPNRAA